MNKLTYAAQQAKLQKDIEKLQKQALALQAKRRRPVLATIVKSMKEYDISPEDVSEAYAKAADKIKSAGSTKAAKTPGVKKPVAAKYRHPQTGATWTGRGKAPLWIVDAEKSGQTREQFLI